MKKVYFHKFLLLVCFILVSCTQYFHGVFIREGLVASNPYTVGKWTIMMYMAADNNLESEAIQDINEIEMFNLDSKGVTVLSLLDRSSGHDGTNGAWEETRLLKIEQDPEGENGIIVSKELSSKELALSVESATELDMANFNTLKSFLQFGYKHYEAENYALIIWGHGNGLRSVISDSYTDSTMSLQELRVAIENGQGEKSLDVIAFDTSFGSTLETIWEIKDSTNWLVGVPGAISTTGWSYKDIFSSFLETSMSSVDFAQVIGSQKGTTAINMQYIHEVKKQFDNLSSLVAMNIDSWEKQRLLKNILLTDVQSYKASTYPSDMFIDVCDFAINISKNAPFITADEIVQNEIVEKSLIMQNTLSHAVLKKDEKSESISVFFISFLAEGIPNPAYPNAYIQSDVEEGKISFVNESTGWVPTNDESVTLLNKLFFTTF